MRLEHYHFPVNDIVFGSTTRLDTTTLVIDPAALRAVMDPDNVFAEIQIDLAKPGEQKRIINIMDVMQPRCKVSGGSSPYPGAWDAPHMAGEGRTHVIDGVCVMQTGVFAGIQEGIVDMCGTGASYSAFSKTCNVILHCVPPENTSPAVFDNATRKALAAASVYLGSVSLGQQPASVSVYETGPMDAALPKVAYIYYLQSQGPLRNTFVYGQNVTSVLPTVLHPNEVLDGAIVSGNYIIACQKNPTYFHSNNPVVQELYALHGHALNFVGVIIANEHSTLADKSRSADFAVKLAQHLGAQGVVMTQEGGGHADSDLMLCTAACQRQGLKSVMLINELAGADGRQPSLVDTSPHATAVISTGNNDQVIQLPAMTQVYGGSSLLRVPDAAAAFTTALGRMYTSTNQLGAYSLQATAY